ncbi:isopentenyl-diphosphate Delta-isomerase [Flavihumibacter petaseus]|nr:isopentenyl-diphosphate Delta-isomerase [Flavihumibacter petaseus]
MSDIVLVDIHDNPIGTMEKMEAHQKALLHRAFSVFIFNDQGEWLLQQRAADKYHSAGLWTNACCSHPRPGEPVAAAAVRRLEEELGFQTSLQPAFSFIYKAEFGNGLTEHEYDHVFMGRYNNAVLPNPDEVAAVRWCSAEEIRQDLQQYPSRYTAWFRLAFDRVAALQLP